MCHDDFHVGRLDAVKSSNQVASMKGGGSAINHLQEGQNDQQQDPCAAQPSRAGRALHVVCARPSHVDNETCLVVHVMSW